MGIIEANNEQEIQSIKNLISEAASNFEDEDEFCGKSKQLPSEEERKVSAKLIELYGLDIVYVGSGYLLIKAE